MNPNIETIECHRTADGKLFEYLSDAQEHDKHLAIVEWVNQCCGLKNEREEIVETIERHGKQLFDILEVKYANKRGDEITNTKTNYHLDKKNHMT